MGKSLQISDVVTIEKTGEHFRLIYDVKGRFTIHRISAEEAKVSTIDKLRCHIVSNADASDLINFHLFHSLHFQYKLCKVKKTQLGAKNVPFLVTHDGRTIRYPDPIIKANDTIQLDIATSKITDHIKFESGNLFFPSRMAFMFKLINIINTVSPKSTETCAV